MMSGQSPAVLWCFVTEARSRTTCRSSDPPVHTGIQQGPIAPTGAGLEVSLPVPPIIKHTNRDVRDIDIIDIGSLWHKGGFHSQKGSIIGAFMPKRITKGKSFQNPSRGLRCWVDIEWRRVPTGCWLNNFFVDNFQSHPSGIDYSNAESKMAPNDYSQGN